MQGILPGLLISGQLVISAGGQQIHEADIMIEITEGSELIAEDLLPPPGLL